MDAKIMFCPRSFYDHALSWRPPNPLMNMYTYCGWATYVPMSVSSVCVCCPCLESVADVCACWSGV
eukprot:10342090-Lingulodinium_polyedra.AAC.1